MLGYLIILMVRLKAGRAEYADGRADVCKLLESVDEFSHDLENLPGITVQGAIPVSGRFEVFFESIFGIFFGVLAHFFSESEDSLSH